MSSTVDVGTPIFGALNEEFELPEITVHEFDVHAFDSLRLEDDAEAAPESEAVTTSEGGRRRKES